MPVRHDLDHLYRNPNTATFDVLVAAAEERGWVFKRSRSSHHIFEKPGFRDHLSIVKTNRARPGTVRNAIKTMMTAETAEGDRQ